ncbi:MAG TPA: heavy-metal-associated domain-containing protein [Ferruginibacter sp.]|jgi:copper chaperone CopZ|nr:heavy-metal-associated domain-containing protein [Ferruginibacter sp.]
MKRVFFAIAMLITVAATAQVKDVSIQASGLTCSMCSNSIFKALKTLDFVEKVDANIKTSSFLVYFKPNAVVDFDRLKAKVEDAGFFVANFTINYHFDDLAIANDQHVTVGNSVFHFLNVKDGVLSGEKKIRLLDKGFVSAKEYKKNSGLTKMACYKTGEENGKRIFHVTI